MQNKHLFRNFLMFSSVLFITACGNGTADDTGGNSGSLGDDGSVDSPIGRPLVSKDQFVLISDIGRLIKSSVLYNGFNATQAQYDALTLDYTKEEALIRDLSAVEPSNLYYTPIFDRLLQAKQEAEYEVTLPGSGIKINTGLTVLNPNGSARKAQESNSKLATEVPLVPTASEPVFLNVPAGNPKLPEAPFFPTSSKYTIVMSNYKIAAADDAKSATFSIEAKPDEGVTFGAFGHYPNKQLTIRVYDDKSTIIQPEPTEAGYVLLSESTAQATINARFLNLTADGLPANLRLNSLTLDETKALGNSDTGFQTWMILPVLEDMFPKLVNTEGSGDELKAQHRFNSNFGVFCLGGANNFQQVDLTDQAFVYPMSDQSINTQVQTLNVDASSGFLAETGNYISVNTLKGQKKLNIVMVLTDSSSQGPIVKVASLEGVDTIGTEVGYVDEDYTLPAAGVVLLEHTNEAGTITIPTTQDMHKGGVAYDAEVTYANKKLTLTKLDKKSILGLGSGAVTRLMAHHPKTQGVSVASVVSLAQKLDPVFSVKQQQANLNTLVTNNAFAPTASVTLSQNITATGTSLDGGIASSMSFNLATVSSANIATNVQYATEQNGNLLWAIDTSAQRTLHYAGMNLTPHASVGYANYALNDRTLTADALQLQTSDVKAHAITFKLATTAEFSPTATSFVRLTTGLEQQFGSIYGGTAHMSHDSATLAGEPINTLDAFATAEFNTHGNFIKFGVFSSKHMQIQFGVTY